MWTTSRRGSSGGSWRRFFFWSFAFSIGCGVRRFRLGQLRLRRDRFRFRGFGFFQRQFKLLDGALDFLRTRTELLAPELGDLRFQLLDGELCDGEAVLGCGKLGIFAEHEPLQLGDVVR
jgi:hypothetical protein